MENNNHYNITIIGAGIVGLAISHQLSKQFKYIDVDTKIIFVRNRIPRTLIKSKIKPKEKSLNDMLFAFTICKYLNSNAIVLVSDLTTIAIGVGQTSRLDSAKIAIDKKNWTRTFLSLSNFYCFYCFVLLISITIHRAAH